MDCFISWQASCEQNDIASVAFISKSEVEILSFNLVKCGGDVSSDGNASIIERGICWGTNQNPTIEDNKIVHESGGTGSFTLNLTGLSNNVSLYIRAYATNKAGTAYGQEVSFILWHNEPDLTVNDVDNNEYSTVKIGEQVWMRGNLKAVHYRNGDPVPKISILQDEMWLAANSGAYCDYDENPDNAAIYGHLYNWSAVNDSSNICPVGWRIPTREDWQELIDYLGGSLEAQQKLIATNLPEFYWTVPDLVLSNYISGFSALP